MGALKGMLIRMKTKDEPGAGTKDNMYVGVVGSGGGSEFPLDVPGFKEFDKGSDIKYWFGDVWDGVALKDARNPFQAHKWNDPEHRLIDIEKVDYVYIRKHSAKEGVDDDAWKMDEVEVILYGDTPEKRTFFKGGDIWLANEYGLQVWLREKTE